MKYIFILCLLIPVIANSLDFDLPTLQPEQAVDLANTYLLEDRNIDPKKYTIISVSYNYVGKTSLSGRWNIMYVGKPDDNGMVAFGDHFDVQIGNGKKPWFNFIGGL